MTPKSFGRLLHQRLLSRQAVPPAIGAELCSDPPRALPTPVRLPAPVSSTRTPRWVVGTVVTPGTAGRERQCPRGVRAYAGTWTSVQAAGCGAPFDWSFQHSARSHPDSRSFGSTHRSSMALHAFWWATRPLTFLNLLSQPLHHSCCAL